MATTTDRLDIRLSPEDKDYIREAAERIGTPVASFVREAAVEYASTVLSLPKVKKRPQRRAARKLSLSEQMRGKATSGLSTEDIMKLMRDGGR